MRLAIFSSVAAQRGLVRSHQAGWSVAGVCRAGEPFALDPHPYPRVSSFAEVDLSV
jgi:hypothetical protein